MTVVLYRDGIIVADTGVWVDNICAYRRNKIRVAGPWAWAASGAQDSIGVFGRWVEGGFLQRAPEAAQEGDMSALAINCEDRSIVLCGHTFRPYDVTDHLPGWHHRGCHFEFCHALFLEGYSAIKVMERVTKHCEYAVGPITAYNTRTHEWVVPWKT